MPTANETKLWILLLFDPLFEQAFLPVAKWPDQPEVHPHLATGGDSLQQPLVYVYTEYEVKCKSQYDTQSPLNPIPLDSECFSLI